VWYGGVAKRFPKEELKMMRRGETDFQFFAAYTIWTIYTSERERVRERERER